MSKGGKKDDKGHYYGFDSSGLEKAATVSENTMTDYYQAAKYLDGSSNAKEAFTLAKLKEETKQLELKDATESKKI